jgi:hypothetical protein
MPEFTKASDSHVFGMLFTRCSGLPAKVHIIYSSRAPPFRTPFRDGGIPLQVHIALNKYFSLYFARIHAVDEVLQFVLTATSFVPRATVSYVPFALCLVYVVDRVLWTFINCFPAAATICASKHSHGRDDNRVTGRAHAARAV